MGRLRAWRESKRRMKQQAEEHWRQHREYTKKLCEQYDERWKATLYKDRPDLIGQPYTPRFVLSQDGHAILDTGTGLELLH